MRVRDANENEFEAEQVGEDTELATKDPDGPVDVAEGTWVLTAEDGSVMLVHPVAFDNNYEEV